MRAKPGFYARNHIDKALFLRYSALFTALLAALLLYSPLFHLIFLSLVLISGGLIPNPARTQPPAQPDVRPLLRLPAYRHPARRLALG